MPSSYELHGRSIAEEPEKKLPLGPYKTYQQALDAGFFEAARKDRAWILMDPPEHSRHTNPTKLKIVDFQPRRQALGLDKAESNIVNISPSKEEEEIMPIGETEAGSRIPICWDSGCNFRRTPQENLEK